MNVRAIDDDCISCKLRRNWLVLLYIAVVVTLILYVLLAIQEGL